MFEFVNNNFWKRTAILQSPMGMNQGFGCALDVSGDYAIVATSQNNGTYLIIFQFSIFDAHCFTNLTFILLFFQHLFMRTESKVGR